jgi:predicted RNA-binding Zn ribbon-like protein
MSVACAVKQLTTSGQGGWHMPGDVAAAEVGFPPDWLQRAGAGPASDLDLAVLLLNTLDLLADPPDRLEDLRWLTGALARVGHAELAAGLAPSSVAPLRSLRDELRPAFEARDDASAAAVLNPMLVRAGAVPLLVPGDGGRSRLVVAPGATGYDALAARLPAAVAAQVAEHGATRLGTCAADPCRCAFVDRTRAATRRYCCSWCNDRQAARTYRRRRAGTGDGR